MNEETIAYDNTVQKMLTKPRARGKRGHIVLIGYYSLVILW